MHPRPSTTLCPICTRLSIIVPGPITVSCPEPRSIVVLAPISTSSPITTRPSCGILIGPCASGAKPKPRAGLYHNMRPDLAILRNRRARIDDRRWRALRNDRRRWIKGLCGAGKSLVRLSSHEQRHAGRRALRKLLVDERGAGAGADKRIDVFAIVEKGHVIGTGGLERGDIAEYPLAARLAPQSRSAQRRKFVKRIGPDPIEEAVIRHAAPGRDTPPLLFLFRRRLSRSGRRLRRICGIARRR